MFRAVQSSRSLSVTAARSKDLVQQAYLNKIKEYAQKGGDLASSDPAVKKALQESLNRLAMKFQLANADVVAKLPTSFEKCNVESSVGQLLEGKTVKDLAETLNKDKSAYLSARDAKKAQEAARKQ